MFDDECEVCLNEEKKEIARFRQGGVTIIELECTSCGDITIKEITN